MSWQRNRFKKKASPVLFPTITCHAWNADKTQIALCANSSEILVFKTNGEEDFTKWEKIHTLTEHGKVVTCISWAPKTNRILSCSQDRNAYVWTLQKDGKWKPVLVLLRIRRAATCCSWSANEDKFAVGSGQKIVSVCFFDPQNNWWVSKVTKKSKHRSTVMSVAFHPQDNTMLLTGSADFKCRYFSAFIKQVDKKSTKKGALGKEFGEWSSKGWVLACAFSPDGTYCAFVGHDSTVTIAEVQNPENSTVIHHKGLPFNSILFLSNKAIVVAGHDCSPSVICSIGGKWTYVGDVEAGEQKSGDSKSSSGGSGGKVQSKFGGGASKFGSSRFGPSKFGSRGGSSGGAGGGKSSVDRRHKMPITEIKSYKQDDDGNTTSFSTCGLDGRILFWDVAKFTAKLSKFAL